MIIAPFLTTNLIILVCGVFNDKFSCQIKIRFVRFIIENSYYETKICDTYVISSILYIIYKIMGNDTKS